MKRTVLRIIAVMLLIMLIVPEAALGESYKATVNTNNTTVYQKANTSSSKLGSLSSGTNVTVESVSGNWAKITYKSKTGYVLVKNLNYATKNIVYASTKTKIYAAASTNNVLCTVSVDYPLVLISRDGDYYKVQDKDGQFTGYIKRSQTSTTRKNPYAVADSAKIKYSSAGSTTTIPSQVKSTQYYMNSNTTGAKLRDYMVFLAETKLGCKYAASGNNKTTFSNHGFVKTCMGYMGYTIPDKTNKVGHTGNGAYVSRANLLKGDIVCFDCDMSDGNIVDHIGIYLGKGYFIHASPAAGCVVISKMSSGYYYKAFCWGRRYIAS
jgi:cell wall-associated NlpC family hydrolase